MQKFIGTKIISAEPRAKDYGPIEQQGQPGYTVVYPDGYTSWSPAAAFEEAYRPTTGIPFGLAIEALKKGMKVARAGWDGNGKGMWLCLSPGRESFSAVDFWAPANRDYALGQGGAAKVLPSISVKTAAGEVQMGWLASQADMLADDWVIVE